MTKVDALERNLGGENLLWSASPKPAASFRSSTLFVIVFGIIWLAMVISIPGTPNKNGSQNPEVIKYVMVAIGIFVILTSLSSVFQAFFTIYGITDKRLLIVKKYPWSTELESFFKQDIEFVKKTKKNDGSGNVVFKTIRTQSGKGYRDKDIGFFGINDVDSVEKIIIENFRNN